MKFVPLIVTDVPLPPDVGVNDVMPGNCEKDAVYEKSVLEVAVPPGPVTEIDTIVLAGPRLGTITVIEPSEFTV